MIMLHSKTFVVVAQVLFAAEAVSKLNEPQGLVATLSSPYRRSHTPSNDDGHRNIQEFEDVDAMPQNYTECDFHDLPFPGRWKNGTCYGLKEECCYYSHIYVSHNFTACHESQTKRPGKWDLGYCESNDISNCCGTRYNFTSCDGCLGLEPWPNLWKDGVCFGFVEDCCYHLDPFSALSFTTCLDSQWKIPEAWLSTPDACWKPSLYDCCWTPENVTTCNAALLLEPWPGMWKDGICFGLIKECCYENNGFSYYFFPTCFESQVKIPGVWKDDECYAHNVSLCCATPQNFTRCEGSLEEFPGMWKDGVCFGLLEECCYDRFSDVLTVYTSCAESQKEIPGEWYNGECYAYNLVECCMAPQSITACEEPQKQLLLGLWKDGVCLGFVEECCYKEDISEQSTFTSCLESQKEIPRKWFDGKCYAYNSAECCGTPQRFSDCEGSLEQFPDMWNNSTTCYGLLEECCYEGNSSEMLTFTSCVESQEQISEAWRDGKCYGYSLEECCETPYLFTACEEPEKPVPDAWMDGVCYGLKPQCCSSSETLLSGIVIAFMIGWTLMITLLY